MWSLRLGRYDGRMLWQAIVAGAFLSLACSGGSKDESNASTAVPTLTSSVTLVALATSTPLALPTAAPTAAPTPEPTAVVQPAPEPAPAVVEALVVSPTVRVNPPTAVPTRPAAMAPPVAAVLPTTAPTPPPPLPAAPASTGVQNVTIRAGEHYFSTHQISVRQGTVRVTFTNEGLQRHTFNVKNLSYRAELFNSQTFDPGQSGTFEFTVLEEGDYVFFCILYGHQNKGQEGVLAVLR